jgi:hypothetical protein
MPWAFHASTTSPEENSHEERCRCGGSERLPGVVVHVPIRGSSASLDIVLDRLLEVSKPSPRAGQNRLQPLRGTTRAVTSRRRRFFHEPFNLDYHPMEIFKYSFNAACHDKSSISPTLNAV